MAGKLSSYGELVTLNSLFRDRTVYMGLATSSVTKNSNLGTITEVTTSGYSRKQVACSVPVQEGGVGTIKNSSRVEFGPWGADQATPITHVFITEQPAGGGEILAFAALTTPKSPSTDELIVLREQDLVVKVQ